MLVGHSWSDFCAVGFLLVFFMFLEIKNSRLTFIKRLFYVGCGGWIWTNDLRVMSPTSYRAAPLRDVFIYLLTRLLNYYSIINSTCQPFFQKNFDFFILGKKQRIYVLFYSFFYNWRLSCIKKCINTTKFLIFIL